jgi:hypothetical protein
LEGSTITRVLRPLVAAGAVLLWLGSLLVVLTSQNYNDNPTFDLFLARVGGPGASHATSYLIFLAIFPIAYVILGSIIPAFLVEVLAFEIHEGLWQIPYYISWHSVIDWRVWVAGCSEDLVITLATIAALVFVYHLPARFFVIVALAWGCFLSAWLIIGFPVTVLSKLPGGQVAPSIYNTVLWVNQTELLGWLYFAIALLLCLRAFRPSTT